MASQKRSIADTKPSAERRPKRRSKVRTQVSDSSSSEESSDTSSPSEDSSSDDATPDSDPDLPDASEDDHQTQEAQSSSQGPEQPTAPQRANSGRSEHDAFSAFYLRAIASELAEDLDKVRSANDFNEGKMPLLIRALKQGEVIFSEEERKTLMQGVKG